MSGTWVNWVGSQVLCQGGGLGVAGGRYSECIMGNGYMTLTPVNRQTPVKTLPSRNFVIRRKTETEIPTIRLFFFQTSKGMEYQVVNVSLVGFFTVHKVQ